MKHAEPQPTFLDMKGKPVSPKRVEIERQYFEHDKRSTCIPSEMSFPDFVQKYCGWIIKAMVLCLMASSAVAADSTARVAFTIYAEAKGESEAGKRSVASVIYNRAGDLMTRKRLTWDAALARTCTRPAFSCWPKHGQPKAPNMSNPAERRAWYQSYELARQIQIQIFEPSMDARHYAERSIRNYWTVSATMLADVGSHRFYQ